LRRNKSQNWKYGTCYLCERDAKQTPEGKLTRDHIPPECFAPEPLASFTATSTSRFQYAYACRACNKHYSDLEKKFKNLMLMGAEGDIQAAEDAWNKVARENDLSILKYGMLSKTIRTLWENMIEVQPRTPAGIYLPPVTAVQIPYDAEELQIAIKIARGLHVVHTGEIVPQTYEMGVAFNERVRPFNHFPPTYGRADTDFFQYLGYTPADSAKVGLWYMRFFKGPVAMVWFRPKK
jgi:hypothetical protein